MAKHGQLEAIITHEEMIVDGRNRFRACVALGLTPIVETWNGQGGSLINFIVARNLHRRHLTAGQRAMLAVEIKKQLSEEQGKPRLAKAGSKGGKKSGETRRNGHTSKPLEIILKASEDSSEEPVNSTVTAAKMVNVNPHYVSDAEAVQEAAPDLAQQVSQGTMTLPEAKRQVQTRTPPAKPKKPKPPVDEVERIFKKVTKDLDNKAIERLTRKLADYCGFIVKQSFES